MWLPQQWFAMCACTTDPHGLPNTTYSLTGGPQVLEDAVRSSLPWARAKGNAAPDFPCCCKQGQKSAQSKSLLVAHRHPQTTTCMFAACSLGWPLFPKGDIHRSSPMCLTSICLTLCHAFSLERWRNCLGWWSKALRNSLHGLRLACRMLFLPQTDHTVLPTGVSEVQSKAACPCQPFLHRFWRTGKTLRAKAAEDRVL